MVSWPTLKSSDNCSSAIHSAAGSSPSDSPSAAAAAAAEVTASTVGPAPAVPATTSPTAGPASAAISPRPEKSKVTPCPGSHKPQRLITAMRSRSVLLSPAAFLIRRCFLRRSLRCRVLVSFRSFCAANALRKVRDFRVDVDLRPSGSLALLWRAGDNSVTQSSHRGRAWRRGQCRPQGCSCSNCCGHSGEMLGGGSRGCAKTEKTVLHGKMNMPFQSRLRRNIMLR